MNNDLWELVIGIEIHIELNTKTKMFSPILNNFNSMPNSNVSNIDLAYPGSLPLVNKEAIIKGIKLAKALNMEIDPLVQFDRKNYFYPDLPKGYQITQQFYPIGKNGKIKIKVQNEWKEVKIERIHLEEDTAKSIHSKDKTYLNYNRAGVPLIEIVSHPVIHSAKEAAAYVEAIRQTALCLNISDAKMNEGSLRTDINISIREKGTNVFNNRVEVKNLNSISNVQKVIEFEAERQLNIYQNGKTVVQETRRFDEQLKETVSMRLKKDSIDYKYFSEPNIPPILIPNEIINNLKIEELPFEKEQRYLANGLNLVQVNQLINNIEYALYFDAIPLLEFKKKANLFFAHITSFLNDTKLNIKDLKLNHQECFELFNYIIEGKINKANVNTILTYKQNDATSLSLKDIIKKLDLFIEQTTFSLEEIITLIFKEQPDLFKNFKQNIDRNKKFLIGQIMKKTMGKAKLDNLDIILNKLVK